MSSTRRLYTLTAAAVGGLIAALLLGPPAQATASTVTGTVGSNNGPIIGGEVAFYDTCEDFEASRSMYAASASIANGSYSVDVPAGGYRVLIWPSPGSGALESWHNAKPSCAEATVVTITGGTTLDLVALPGANVAGTVSSSKGPVASGSVSFYDTCQHYTDGKPIGSGSFNSGSYSLSLPNGTYRVRISPDGGTGALDSWHNAKATCADATVVTISGDTTRNLVALPGSNVTGTVSSSNGTVSGGSVRFYATCQDHPEGKSVGWAPVIGGSYSVTVPDGTYVVHISADAGTGALASWHSAKATCADATVVTISGDTTRNLVALPGSNVTGTVSTSAGPVAGGSVSFYATCQDYKNGEAAGHGQWNTVWGPGGFTVSVPDGTYRVQIYAAFPVEVLSWHNAKPSCAEATPVTITGDTTLDLVASVGRTITGTVSSSKAPVKDGLVAFFPNCEEQAGRSGVNASSFKDGQPYRVTIPDGSYRVFIAPASGTGAVESWHHAKTTCEQASVVTVTGDTTLDLVALAEGSATPAPTPSPTAPTPQPTAPVLGTQKVTRPPKKLAKGRKAKLARTTKQGARVAWKAKTKTVCTVRKYKVTALKKGKCTLKATAPALRTFSRYSKVFTIRVK